MWSSPISRSTSGRLGSSRNAETPGFIESIRVNTMRYHDLLSRAIDECMPEPVADDGFEEPIGVNRDGGTKEQLRRKAAAEE